MKGNYDKACLEHLITYIPHFVFWKDLNSTYLGCNENFAQMAGIKTPKEIIGKSDFDLAWHDKAQDYRNEDLEVIAGIHLQDKEVIMDMPGGKQIIILVSKVPLRDEENKIIGVLGIYTNITHQKQQEKTLLAAKEKAEAASRAKSIFLANMSHDIKTPIAGIISTAEYLANKSPDSDYKSHSDDIVQSGSRLMDLMIEIIEASRLEVRQTARTKTRFKLNDLLNDIAQLLKPAFVDKPFDLKIKFDKKIPKYLIGDRWHLYRVILNLLSNAIKFTKSGTITIGVEIIKKLKKSTTIKVSVSDTGIGIPKDKQAVIFDDFTRLTPSYEGIYKGTGLGLFIVKQFVEAMDGEIYVESEEGKGSTFTCVIPFKIPLDQKDDINDMPLKKDITTDSKNNPISAPTVKNSARKNNIKILLVEDNIIASRSAKGILEFLGCSVDTAFTGKEALQLFEPNKYNLIYMDLGLPDLDGIRVVQKIRLQEKDKSHTQIIALSAHVDSKINKLCMKAGMDTVQTKPLLKEQIIDQIKTYDKTTSKCANTSTKNTDKSTNNENKIIDLDLGASIIHSTVDEAKANLKMLFEVLPDTLDKIKSAYISNDLQSLSNSAHKLHGGLSYCGVPRLKEAVKNLELETKSGNTKNLEQYYQNFLNEMKLFFEEYVNLYT